MPRSKDYIRIKKEKFYYTMALWVTRGGDITKRIAELEIYWALMEVEIDTEVLLQTISIIKNGYRMDGLK